MSLRRVTLIVVLVIIVACTLIAYLVLRDLAQPRVVAAQPAAVLIRIGGNAGRPLALNEVGWLLSEPGAPDVTRRCEGCDLALLACNRVCTYRVVARRLDWVARVGELEARQGARVWLPIGGIQ